MTDQLPDKGPNTELVPGKGITVTYDEIKLTPRMTGVRWSLLIFFGLLMIAAAGAAGYYASHHELALTLVLVSIGSLLAGANTVTYDANGPIPAGTTPPNAQQSFNANTITAVITGDGSTTGFTVTHNWGFSTAGTTAAVPWSFFEPLSSVFYTANPFVSSRAGGNAVVYLCVGFSGAAFRVRLERPFSPDDNQHF